MSMVEMYNDSQVSRDKRENAVMLHGTAYLERLDIQDYQAHGDPREFRASPVSPVTRVWMVHQVELVWQVNRDRRVWKVN